MGPGLPGARCTCCSSGAQKLSRFGLGLVGASLQRLWTARVFFPSKAPKGQVWPRCSAAAFTITFFGAQEPGLPKPLSSKPPGAPFGRIRRGACSGSEDSRKKALPRSPSNWCPTPDLSPFFGWEGSPTKIDQKETSGYQLILTSQIWRT